MQWEEILFEAALGLYLVATIAYLVRFAARWRPAGTAATTAAWTGLLLHTAMLVLRGISAGHVPLVSFYEYLNAFAWMVVLAYLVFEWRSAKTIEGAEAVGGPALMLAVALLAYASWLLPHSMKQTEALMPVLRSNWLIFHVSTAVVAYGAAGLASALAVLYIISNWLASPPGEWRTKKGWRALLGRISDWLKRRLGWMRERLPSPPRLDRGVYQAVRFAFPFLTLLNVTGAVWAYNAWGRYWGWDPKETWALITWLIYAFYLHARLRAEWRPPRTNMIVVVGLVAVLFTFLGVNQLAAFANSMHSYASGG
jgi:cytochrome c-type biogenesis protein CcsB